MVNIVDADKLMKILSSWIQKINKEIVELFHDIVNYLLALDFNLSQRSVLFYISYKYNSSSPPKSLCSHPYVNNIILNNIIDRIKITIEEGKYHYYKFRTNSKT